MRFARLGELIFDQALGQVEWVLRQESLNRWDGFLTTSMIAIEDILKRRIVLCLQKDPFRQLFQWCIVLDDLLETPNFGEVKRLTRNDQFDSESDFRTAINSSMSSFY